MQHISKRNNIKAIVLNRVQLVDLVTVKHKVEVVQIKHVTRDDVWKKLFQWRSAASYF